MPNISYIEEGNGKTILFLHGWGQNKEMMYPLIEQLKNNYKCIIVDMPGFGDSKFNGEKNIEEYTETIKNFLEEKKIAPDYIVGHSFGGKVALKYYLKYKNIKGLIFIASPLLKPKRSIIYYYKIAKHKLKKKLKFNIQKSGSEDYRNCSDCMKTFFISVVNTHFDKEIKNIEVPVLLVWGRKDEKVPLFKAVKLHNIIKKSELQLENGGHFAYLENIEFTRLVIQRFMRRLVSE